jgi:hypothetical protein
LIILNDEDAYLRISVPQAERHDGECSCIRFDEVQATFLRENIAFVSKIIYICITKEIK